MQKKTFALVHVERSEFLTDSMGSEMLSPLCLFVNERLKCMGIWLFSRKFEVNMCVFIF